MAHHNTILSQILRLIQRHDFKRLAFEHDGKRRSDAISRWKQFVSMAIAQLCGRCSLRDSNHFRVCCWVVKRFTLVCRRGNDRAVTDDHRADRHFVGRGGHHRLFQGLRHPKGIGVNQIVRQPTTAHLPGSPLTGASFRGERCLAAAIS